MDILERYLQAVKFWLPRSQQQDIIAELRDELSSQIEDQESALGRPLTDDELNSIIQKCGHPMLVSSRFLPQNNLIGPVLFPVYVFVLKMVALCYLLPWFVVWTAMVIFLPSYRAEHPGLQLPWTLHALWNLGLYLGAFITLGFAIADKVMVRNKWLENWDPRHLPPAVKREMRKYRQPRFESMAGLVFGLLMLIAWLAIPRFSLQLWAPTPNVTGLILAPGLRTYYMPVLLLMLVEIAMYCWMLFRANWTWLPPAVRLVTTAIALGLLKSVMKVYPYLVLVHSGNATAHDVQGAAALNQIIQWSAISTGIGFTVALIIYAVQCARHLRRWMSDSGKTATLSNSQVL